MRRTRQYSRRQFLKRSAAAAGAAALAPALGSLPSKVARAVPANERINMGFIGIGNMGSGLLQWYTNNPEVQVVAISEVKDDVAEWGKERVAEVYADRDDQGSFSGVDTYVDFRDLLAREDIDAVVIATPDHWHGAMTVLACQAGKDIYCEKPLSFDVGDAHAMVKAVRRYGRVFQTGSQQRSDWNFRFGCELVRNGYIGELEEVRCSVGGPSWDHYLPPEPVPDGVDWDRWLGPSPWHPYNSERISGSYSGGWRLIRDTSGGMMTDWGAHHFDIAQWGMGMDGHGPVEIYPPGVEDHEYLTYYYDNGVVMKKNGANGVLFIGSEGRVEVNRGHIQTWPANLMDVRLTPDDERLYDSSNHRQDWLDCIKTRQRPICDVEIGASSITVSHLGNIAFWLNRGIQWDPVAKEIIDDAEASRWLKRPKREPYAWI